MAGTSYRATAQPSSMRPHASGYMNPALMQQSWQNLAQDAENERRSLYARAADRQNAVIGGYNQQIADSRAASAQGYGQLEADYGALTADALATRQRNMDRINQYGNSMRQDLDIANQQRLAKARQSAIQRGLGNTTIQDSLVRGQNFDNTRQQLTLEDQLLQNRIATDSQLSGAYQGALQTRAQGLNTQRNINVDRDNALAQSQLGYIGGIQDDMQGFQAHTLHVVVANAEREPAGRSEPQGTKPDVRTAKNKHRSRATSRYEVVRDRHGRFAKNAQPGCGSHAARQWWSSGAFQASA
jgi:hypothetical protein